MVDVVARQAAHVTSIVLPTLPVEMTAIHRVALQARLIRLGGTPLSRIADIPFAGGLSARFSMLLGVCVADFAFRCT